MNETNSPVVALAWLCAYHGYENRNEATDQARVFDLQAWPANQKILLCGRDEPIRPRGDRRFGLVRLWPKGVRMPRWDAGELMERLHAMPAARGHQFAPVVVQVWRLGGGDDAPPTFAARTFSDGGKKSAWAVLDGMDALLNWADEATGADNAATYPPLASMGEWLATMADAPEAAATVGEVDGVLLAPLCTEYVAYKPSDKPWAACKYAALPRKIR